MYSPFVEFAVSQGVPLGTVTLILMLPVVVMIIAFFRQVIGIKAFGIYTPALIIFAFLAIRAESGSFWAGIRYGTAIFATVIAVGTIARILLRHFRLLYLPRVAIVISIVSLSTLLMLIFVGMYQRTGLASVSIFPILIMITLVEKFVAVQIEKGKKTAVYLSLETLTISIIGYSIASWPLLIVYLQQWPWLVFVAIFINVLLGKWTGLRLSEFIRFKKLIKNV